MKTRASMYRAGADAARRYAGAHLGRDRRSSSTILDDEEGHVDARVHRQRLQLRRHRPELRPAFVKLKDWDERAGNENSARRVAGARERALLAASTTRMIFAVHAAGRAGTRQRRPASTSSCRTAAAVVTTGCWRRATSCSAWPRKDPRLASVRPNGLEDTPQFKLDIDQAKASALGVSIADINTTLQTALGVPYVNDFIDRGRVKRVYVQGDAPFRMQPDDLNRWYVRNAQRRHGAVLGVRDTATGPTAPQKLDALQRRAGLPDPGRAAPGVSSGEAMDDDGGDRGQTAAGHRPRVDRPVVPGAAVRRAGAAAVRAVAARSCSCASRRCTRAGRSRSRCCSSCRSASSARCSRRRCARPRERRLLPGRRC